MTMKLITQTITSLTSPDYDINVYTEREFTDVDLTFYPLVYPGDPGYRHDQLFGNKDWDVKHGIPVADYTRWYTLKIPKNPRGPRYQEALGYLEALVTEGSFGDIWDLDGMDWTSCETVLTDAPYLIQEFMDELPKRGDR